MYRLSREGIDDSVVEAAAEAPIANETVRDITGLSREEALALLRRLVSESRLERVGQKRGTRYVAGE